MIHRFEFAVSSGMLAAVIGLCSLAAAQQPAAVPVDFARQIRPILSDKCFFCHGPDPKHREAELRLDSRAGVFEHAGDAKIVVPGQPDKSELWRRITHADADQRMPPAAAGKTLNDKERELIRRWIQEGAAWQEHWSLRPLLRPSVPEVDAAPRTAGAIDRFWLAKLKAEGLSPSPPADPRTLARRCSFDLLGLPPTPEQVEAFAKGFEEDPDRACGEFVERLLESPHHGERLAMHWLDLVRYADTVGYHGDQEHPISPYRDYVIQAFIDNMPFDRFTAEQLAGDLLPDASVDQKIASGYNRLLQTSHEGGVQQKEYLAKYSADRVRNFGSVWLGLTVACSECHDHKFDPLPQRDFYRLAAFFADVDDLRSFKGGDTTPTKREPELQVLSGLDRRRIERLDAELTSLVASSSTANDEMRIADLKKQIETARKQTRRTMVTESIDPRPTRLLSRGDWMDDTGPVVEPGVPGVLPPLEKTDRATRLDLARWLTAKDHPLTARVFVNRLWKLYFGRGLAGSLDDFGSQGQPPTHPELLDWLASEFVDSGWNVRHLVRLIVLSQAYRQSSLETPALRERDPENRLLARQARPRLDAELIRDNVLATSGLLVADIGGWSARPYQPEDYYQHLNFPKRKYVDDKSQQQYRRGVYVHWQRSFLHPMLKAFDAPTREECCAERPTSNTPQAALVTLNDPTFVEAARVYAARIIHEGGADHEARLRWAWRTALSRDPNDRELAALSELWERDAAEFRSDAVSAQSLLKIGMAPLHKEIDPIELAAWTSVARAIFNLSEFMTRN